MKSLIAIFLLTGMAVFAQTTGELQGTVSGPDKKVLAHAQVTATFDQTGVSRKTETDGDGDFIFSSFPVGECTVEVEADGYKPFVQRYVQVTLGHVIHLPVQLEPGEATKVIAAETPLIETESTQIGAIVGGGAVISLP